MSDVTAWSSKAYPFSTDESLQSLIDKFRDSKVAQEVSFRDLVPWLKVGERATHYIHTYPAKLLPHIAHFFLASQKICAPKSVVLDPFSGTGTVALEAMLSGHQALYADANPLARMISSVKARNIDSMALQSAFSECLSNFKKCRARKAPEVVNIDHWYTPETIRVLVRLKSSIDLIQASEVRNFFLVTFSAVARKCSLADPRLSVPVRLKEYAGRRSKKNISVLSCFTEQFETNCKRIQELANFSRDALIPICVGPDARQLKNEQGLALEPDVVDLIITSPPYAGAQKYIRATSLSLGWLGFVKPSELRSLEDQNIGREHIPKSKYLELSETGIVEADEVLKSVYLINPLRAAIAATYLVEMREALTEMCRVLKPGGRLVLVIGNNVVCGQEFMSSDYLTEICKGLGLTLELSLLDAIKSRGLMTKRNKTASVISREWVLLFRK